MTEREAPEAETGPRRRRDWDGVAAIIASLVGLLALVVSAYTASVQRQQVRAQVWMRLSFQSSDADRSLMVVNKGVGPARIESFRLYVDGRAQPDWAHVFAALKMAEPADFGQSTLHDSVIAANERLDFLHFSRAEDWAAFRASAPGRVKFRTCYCSVLDECVLLDQRSARPGHGSISDKEKSVDRCDRVEADEFTN